MKSLITRTISGVVFLAILLTSLLWCQEIFAFVFGFIITVMMYEYLRITVGKKHVFGQVMSYMTALGVFVLSYMQYSYGLPSRYYLLLALPLALIYISLLYDKDKENYRTHMALLSAPIYTALPFSLCNAVIHTPDGTFTGHILLSMFIMLWASDVGAYLSGITFGQRKNARKLFPSISPNKSWAGYIGGLASTLLASYILSYTGYIQMNAFNAITIGLIINIFGTFGDLAESQLKRNYGIKDSGKIMPGHGGLLDRFDGALLSFPPAIAYILLIMA